jgi:SOS response regulatory protein OraA/RecX
MFICNRKEKQKMDLSVLQKVNELKEQGRSAEDIKQELRMSGISPENIIEALQEVGVSTNQQSAKAPTASPPMHREKIIQPSPGFDPNAK